MKRFCRAVVIVSGIAAFGAPAGAAEAQRAALVEVFENASTIGVGKIISINDAARPRKAEIKLDRCLYSEYGPSVASFRALLPASGTPDGVAYAVGDEGIWVASKRPEDAVRRLPLADLADVIASLAGWMDRRLASLTAALVKEAKEEVPFGTDPAREVAKEVVNLIRQERLLSRPATYEQSAARLSSIYRSLGIEPGFPLNPKTEEEVAAALKVALAHPFFRGEPIEPDSARYQDIVKKLPMLLCVWCEDQLACALTLSDDDLKQIQERLGGTAESARAKLDTRVDVLAEIMRLTREGKLPK